jgi:hypothetical protein
VMLVLVAIGMTPVNKERPFHCCTGRCDHFCCLRGGLSSGRMAVMRFIRINLLPQLLFRLRTPILIRLILPWKLWRRLKCVVLVLVFIAIGIWM